MPKSFRSHNRAGFTLLELMIVVAIVGILAATAMPAFQGYLMRGRANEGRMMVEMIKLRQEAYRSEFGQYVTAGANPGAINGINYVPWVATPAWTALGFSPPGNRTRFSLETIAGLPGAAPGGFGLAGNDFSFVTRAVGDFNEDGNMLVFVGSSESDQIFCNSTAGWR